MKYGYMETRRISAMAIRGLCIKNNWFTLGDSDEYFELLDYGNKDNITSDELVEMATLIKEYSETEYSITNIMYELCELCHSFFEEV